jgi:hypothetical protein
MEVNVLVLVCVPKQILQVDVLLVMMEIVFNLLHL